MEAARRFVSVSCTCRDRGSWCACQRHVSACKRKAIDAIDCADKPPRDVGRSAPLASHVSLAGLGLHVRSTGQPSEHVHKRKLVGTTNDLSAPRVIDWATSPGHFARKWSRRWYKLSSELRPRLVEITPTSENIVRVWSQSQNKSQASPEIDQELPRVGETGPNFELEPIVVDGRNVRRSICGLPGPQASTPSEQST